MVTDVDDRRSAASITVSVAVKLPAAAYTWVASAVVAEAPSPNCSSYRSLSPGVPRASNVTSLTPTIATAELWLSTRMVSCGVSDAGPDGLDGCVSDGAARSQAASIS